MVSPLGPGVGRVIACLGTAYQAIAAVAEDLVEALRACVRAGRAAEPEAAKRPETTEHRAASGGQSHTVGRPG